MNSKNLHKHALPIVSLAVAVMLAAAGVAVASSSSDLGNSTIASGLTKQVATVKSTSVASMKFQLTAAKTEAPLPDLGAVNQALALGLAVQTDN
jgi:hypothetical protein